VPFTFTFWKIQESRQLKNTENTKIKYNSENTNQNAVKLNYPRPGNEVGLFYDASKPIQGITIT